MTSIWARKTSIVYMHMTVHTFVQQYCCTTTCKCLHTKLQISHNLMISQVLIFSLLDISYFISSFLGHCLVTVVTSKQFLIWKKKKNLKIKRIRQKWEEKEKIAIRVLCVCSHVLMWRELIKYQFFNVCWIYFRHSQTTCNKN